MHYKQENKYGCGLYSVANALQENHIITENRIEWSKDGNNIGQLNRWLEQSDYDFFIQMIVYNNNNPIEIFDLEPVFGEKEIEMWMPFFLVIKSTEKKNHMIACRYMRNRSIIVHDSNEDSEIIFPDFNSFNEHYKGEILSYECFYNFKNEPIFIIPVNNQTP
ncbi:hypothetical protein [Bacteroides sp. 51]|uniref:hypothetical protein n=1 Tax=Bacteroides sp. 51 TaxID=2302938 RepID=UPI0013D221B7|nr:hypothetical protein [Bacteroides sp. 51]NDV81303.1 hypothetical protein [Bacteroides sp. 51]